MMLSVIKAVREITDAKFKAMMLAGAFKNINYSENTSVDGTRWHTYNMFEYADTHARYMKLVDSMLKEKHMTEVRGGQELGIFTRKSSNGFLTALSVLIEPITELDVVCHEERFHSFADRVKESM